MIGETVTHYRILDKIGEGGMGVVYRAEDTRLGRQVAVKFLSAKLLQDPSALERFQREAKAASALNHPHICALYDIGQKGNLPFLVMELLNGTTLRHRINSQPLPLDTLLEYATQITDALDTAHARGIIHRDVKSANIFVTDRGQIKMLDFGLAKLDRSTGPIDPFADTQLAAAQPTEIGQQLGTLSFMSPEQARGEEVDARTDLFSFGVVLYEMATGREPFSGRTSGAGHRRAAQLDAEPAVRRQPVDAGGARAHHHQGAREGSRPPLPDRRRTARRPQAAAARDRLGADARGYGARHRRQSPGEDAECATVRDVRDRGGSRRHARRARVGGVFHVAACVGVDH
jgi:serine/threonine protein kinase